MKSTLRPIILGGDIGSYATARAFHQEYGVTTVIIAGTKIGPVADSSIIDLRIVPDLAGRFVEAISQVMAEQPQATHILLGSVDWWVEELVHHRDALAPAIIPYAESAAVDEVTNKASFARLCQRLGIPHPQTVVVAPGQDLPESLPLPMVVKVADSGAFRDIEFSEKNKVEFFDTRAELQEYLSKVKAAGYTGEFVVQEFVPGGDDSMAAVNAFYGSDGAAHLFVYGRVLLEEHTPNGLGNSVAQITGSDPDFAPVMHARTLLDHLGWAGFANIDMKIRGDEHLFFELNPRVGRSGFAVTAAGYNVARHYVETFVNNRPAPKEPEVAPPAHLFTVVPLGLVKKYAPAWASQIRKLKRSGRVTNAYYYRAERSLKRWFYIAVAMLNQYRKFAQHHPSRRSRDRGE